MIPKNGRRYRNARAVSSGGIVYRAGAEGPEVVLVQTPGKRWGLPKGTPERGEALEQTALREVQEETGLEVELDEKVGVIEYWFNLSERRERVRKFVHFWLMRPTGGGDISEHDHEHVDVRWYPIAEAISTVSHKNTVGILEQAQDLLLDDARGSAGAAG